MPDWIKTDEASFNTQNKALRLWAGIPANAAAAGLGSTEVNELINTGTNWDTTYAAKVAHDAAGAPIIIGCSTAREMAEDAMRPIGQMLRAKVKSGVLTAAQLALAGIPPVDSTPTPSVAPTTRPILAIHPDQRLEHKVT